MLILQRKVGQSIYIGEDIIVTVQEISSDKVKLSIDAPKDIKIMRDELKCAENSNIEALSSSNSNIELLKKMLDK